MDNMQGKIKNSNSFSIAGNGFSSQPISGLKGIESEMKMCLIPSEINSTSAQKKTSSATFDKANLTQKIANLANDSTSFVKDLKFIKNISDTTKIADNLTRNINNLKVIANTVTITLSTYTIQKTVITEINQSIVLIEDYIVQLKSIKIDFNIPSKIELATKQLELENLTKSMGSRIQIAIGRLVAALTQGISTFVNKSPQAVRMINSLGKLMRVGGYVVNQLSTIGAVFAYFEFDKAGEAYEQNPNDETERAFYVKFINVIIACIMAVLLAALAYFGVTVSIVITILLIIVAGLDIILDMDLFAEGIYEIFTNVIPNMKTYIGEQIKKVETNANSIFNEIERKIKGIYGLP